MPPESSNFHRTLAQQAEAEVMACIGCHDCMLACPLPQAQTIGIAELNAAVDQPVITSPRVIDFLSACTQCRQCVPVCPADLSRADMVLFNKIKVEDAIPDHTLTLQIGDEVVPSSWTLDGMAKDLSAVRLFTGTAQQDLRRVLLKSTLRQLEAMEELCREGEFHERLYIVLSGSLEQTSDVAGHKLRILLFAPGSFFGELAIMADAPEPFGVRALATSIVLEIPKAAVHHLMQQSPTFRATMDELYRRRALWTYARKPTVFGNLPEPAMEELVAAAELAMIKPGQVVFREGDAPRDVYLVRSGFLRASRRVGEEGPPLSMMARRLPIGAEPSLQNVAAASKEKEEDAVLTYFREGDLIGALPLALGETRHSFTVIASSRAEVIRIPGAVLLRVLARYPQAHDAMVKGAMEVEQVARNSMPRAKQSQVPQQAPAPAQGRVPRPTHVLPMSWSALVDAGIAQGHEVLVVDQNKCVNCKNCIDACSRRHGHSRLQLRGLQVENLLFPTACRHCDDPVCLLCSVNGIVRRPTGEIAIVEENCIGCGACAQRCPYGNITMHPVETAKKGWIASLLDLLKGGDAKAAYEREIDPKVPQKAHKCDLCAEYDDYACVTACPVGAMFRVDPKVAMETLGAPQRSSAPGGSGAA
jgi:CRP-like cAMP-binding protein/Fe-S-cluster-containing hydrogenase component 2